MSETKYKLVLKKVTPKRVKTDEERAIAKAKRDARQKSDQPKVQRPKANPADKEAILSRVTELLGVSLDEANEYLLSSDSLSEQTY
jgi:hypothetical protein